jgi:hypothetical protein
MRDEGTREIRLMLDWLLFSNTGTSHVSLVLSWTQGKCLVLELQEIIARESIARLASWLVTNWNV